MWRRLFPLVLGLLLIVGIPGLLSAKGRTVRITISGADLKSPIQITDPRILANFNVWTGPGTSSREGKGLIVDWSQGAISPLPKTLPLYEIFFYADFGNHEEKQVYEVSYEYDPSTQRGYVHLPGKEDKWWRLNVSSIFRGVEGNWFSAWGEWEKVARPLIENAKAATSAPPSTCE